MKRLALAAWVAASLAAGVWFAHPGRSTDLPLAVSDGTNTIYGVQNLIFSGGMVTGATPNATVVVGGGGGGLLPPNAALLGGTGTTFTSVVVGTGLSLSGGVLSATVPSESISASPSPCLTTSPAPITGVGTVALQSPLGVACGGLGTGSLTANAVVLGNGTNPVGTAAPGTSGFVLTSNGPSSPPSFQVAPSGTLTSVTLAVPAELTVTPSSACTGPSCSFTIGKANELPNTVWAGPASGSPAPPTFRALVPGDIPGLGGGTAWTLTTYTSNTATLTLASTTQLVEVISQAAPAALTINLAASGLSSGFIQCVKDGANNFQANPATVKTTDSSTIDGTAGATGFPMANAHQEACFIYDGAASWYVM